MYLEDGFNVKEIDMRREFDSLNSQLSMKVLLIRQNKKSRCKCYSSIHKDGDTRCKICGGTGKLSFIEQVSVIHDTFYRPFMVQLAQMGLSVNNTVVFYMDHKIVPRPQDRILMVGFDQYGVPVDIKKSCVIASIDENRGDDGRVEAYTVYAKYAPEKIELDQRRLNSLPPKVKFEISKGRRYSWPTDSM